MSIARLLVPTYLGKAWQPLLRRLPDKSHQPPPKPIQIRILQPQAHAIRQVILPLDHLQQRQLAKPLVVVVHKLPRARQDLIGLVLADLQQHLAGERLPRGRGGGAEEALAEEGRGRPAAVDLEAPVGLVPVQHGGGLGGGAAVVGGEGAREEHGALEEGWGWWDGVQVAEEQGGGEVVAARALAQGDDLVRVAAVGADVGLDPLEGGGDVLGAVGPVAALEGEAVGGEDGDEALLCEVIG